MSWYKLSYKKASPIDFEGMFGKDYIKNMPKIIEKSDPQVKEQIITLYRGFDADLENVEKIDGNYILRPEKCEQGVLWFTHSLMGNIHPIEYVKGRGKYILTYPIKVKKHYHEVFFDNGSKSSSIPDEIIDLSDPFNNSKYWMGIELPDGFYFSYKTEKFIISEIPIVINTEMIQEDDKYELV